MMNHGWLSGLVAGACLLSGQMLMSMEQVFRFSDSVQLSLWKIESQVLDKLVLSKRFASHAGLSLRFASPAWRGDMPEWPSCTGTCEAKDWTGYDRLVLDVTNPGAAAQKLSFFASDSKVPFRKGFNGRCRIEGQSFKRFVFELKKIPKNVNRRDMSVVHLYTERPGADMEIFVGGMYLLKPGEALPAYSATFTAQLRELYKPLMASSPALVETTLGKFSEYQKIPGLRAYLEGVRKDFMNSVGKYSSWLGRSDVKVETLQELREFVTTLRLHCARMEGDLEFLKDAVAAGQDVSRMVVGTASTMKKIMPRDVKNDIAVASTLTSSLARNEREGLQVVVMAQLKNLQNVQVNLSALKHESGATLKGEVDVVGYVQTLVPPPYAVSYVGWWPDPLLRGSRTGAESNLDQCGAVTVKAGEVQAFWLRFHSSKTQPAGVYKGTVTVSADGVQDVTLPLAVRVYPFCLPDNTPLPTAISFNHPVKQMTQKVPLETMTFTYADFLADYKIDYGYLYSGKAPDWEVLTYLHKQGKLTAFTLGYFGVGAKDFDRQMERLVRRFKPHYQKAKELGLLDHAYLYGFDEAGKERFPEVEKCYARFNQEFPEVLTMTTTYDHTFGTDSIIKSVKAWCPLTPKFDPKMVAKAHEQGRWVWWYICCGPQNPWANWFIEYDAIEARLLMGAQTAKYRPDGFLYYATTIWNDNMGIDCAQGPFTTWNPVSWTVYHGDGSLFYCDKNGYPLPSIRLENYRDGQEDYAYACILQEAIRQVKAKKSLTAADQAWLKDAEAAMVVPESLVKSMKEYSRDPQCLLTWRNRMAEAIAKSRLENLNPWGPDFGVRGWRK